jgi:indole-3-glycerol phosphate synthase
MNDTEAVAPAVRSILERADERGGGERIEVEPRSLPAALEHAAGEGRVPVIAEIKPTSPTTDGEHGGDPVELAEAMVAGGAAALSVLTEPEQFGGSPGDLRRVREAVDVPVLRKDFLLSELQFDTVAADIVLLIARFVEDLPGLVGAARDRGFQVLVEVHSREELSRALDAGADIVGVNNRDLSELVVDLETFGSVAPAAPADVTLVAESGIGTPADARQMRQAGADGLLVGSAILNGETTVEEATRRLTAATGPTETNPPGTEGET